MATPNGIANNAAMIMPPMLPSAGDHCRYAKAPAPTNVICAKEICFDQPVSGTNDTMIRIVSTGERDLPDADTVSSERHEEHDQEQEEHPERGRLQLGDPRRDLADGLLPLDARLR